MTARHLEEHARIKAGPAELQRLARDQEEPEMADFARWLTLHARVVAGTSGENEP